jgi:hypothetical protein
MKGDTRLTRLARPTTTHRSEALPWRRIAASVVAISLLSLLTISLAGAAGAESRASRQSNDQPKVYQPSGHGTALAHGVVDMAKLSILQPHAVTTAQTPPLPAPDALTPPSVRPTTTMPGSLRNLSIQISHRPGHPQARPVSRPASSAAVAFHCSSSSSTESAVRRPVAGPGMPRLPQT